jgi:hypothetical protein
MPYLEVAARAGMARCLIAARAPIANTPIIRSFRILTAFKHHNDSVPSGPAARL